MLTTKQVATIRAALVYWQEEMCPNGNEIMMPYFEAKDAAPLSREEISELRQQLATCLRFTVYDPAQERLDGTELFADMAEARLAAGKHPLASVILPRSQA